MEWLALLQYAPQALTFCKGTRDAVVAWRNGNTTEAVHATIRGIKPLLVGAVGVNVGPEFSKAVGLSSRIASGFISSTTGATVDYAVSTVTDRPFGLVKSLKEDNYPEAVRLVAADFGYGAQLADDSKEY